MVYSTGDAQVTNDPQAKGGYNAQAQQQEQQTQQPLVQNEPQNPDGQQPQQPESQQPAQQKPEDVQQLEQRLGYSTEQLGQEQQPEKQPQQDSGLDPKMEQALEQYFEHKFGVPPDQIQQQFQELQQFKQEQLVKQQEQALRQEWGDAYDERIQQVKEYFQNRLSKEQQKSLDNADGARLIWAKIQQEQAQNQPQPPNFQPQQGKSPEQLVTQPSSSYMFTKSQLDKMSLKEYNDNIKNIEYAMSNGLVNYQA